MNGVEMMMKSFGIDPVKIKAELTEVFKTTTDNVMREVTAIKTAQERIEKKLDLLNQHMSGGSMDSMPTVDQEEIEKHGRYVNGAGIDYTDRN
jgi:hypothetical protein